MEAIIDLGEDYRSPRDTEPPLRERLNTRRNRRALALAFTAALLAVACPPPPANPAFVSVAVSRDVLQSTPIIVGDLLIAVTRPPDGGPGLRVGAYRLPDGAFRWTIDLEEINRVSGARASGGLVLVEGIKSDGETVIVLDPSTGRVISQFDSQVRIVGAVAVELAYLDDRGQLLAELTGRDLRTSRNLWVRRVPVTSPGFVYALLAVPSRSLVVLMDPGGQVYAVDAASGEVRASARVPGPQVIYATIVDDFAYVVTEDDMLTKLDPATLTRAWTVGVPDGLSDCGDVFCDDQDINPEVIDPRSGRRLFDRSLTWKHLLAVPGGWLALTRDPAELLQVNPATTAFVDSTGYGARPVQTWAYIGRDTTGAPLLMRSNISPALTWFARLDETGEIRPLGMSYAAARNCQAAVGAMVCSLGNSGFEIFGG